MTARPEADNWSARLANLAALSQYDGLAIVLPGAGAPTTYAAHNLPTLTWSASPAARTIALRTALTSLPIAWY